MARRAASAGAALALAVVVGMAVPAAAQSVVVAPGGGPDVRLFDSGGNNHGSFFAYDPGFDGGVHVAVGDVNGDGRGEIVTGAGPGGGPSVRVLDSAGNLESSFFAYASSFPGGVRVAVGDVDGDKRGEIITGAGPGGGPQVRILDPAGNAKGTFYPYDPAFAGGVSVAAGDLDGDGRADIVTGAGPGGGPNVKVFDDAGNTKANFYAYDPGFGGGVSVAVGDVDGDGRADIITGPGPGGGPNVRVFDGNGNLKSSFFAYDPGFQGGITVAAGGLGSPRIVTGPGATGGPEVRVFDASGSTRGDFLAYDPGYRGGVNVAVGNVDGSSRIVTGAGVEQVLRVLHPGDTGADVLQMQQRLSDLGYWVPVDGSFGTLTEQAVWAFEKVQGLARDGVFGGDNWSSLNSAVRPRPRSGGDLLEIDKARQVLFLVRDGQVVWTFNTSTGTEGPYTFGGQRFIAHTPTGGFTIISQFDGYQNGRLGTLYRPKYFTSWGVAVHGSPSIPPYPASHGCVRVSNAAIDFLWNNGLAPLGSTVIVY